MDVLKVYHLKKFLKSHRIKCSKMKKKELKKTMVEYLAARTIQFFFHKKKENRCVICLDDLYFPFINVQRHRYHVQCLTLYINKIGRIEDSILHESLLKEQVNIIEAHCETFHLKGIEIDYKKIELENSKNEEEIVVLQAIDSMLNEIESDESLHSLQELEMYLQYFFSLNNEYCIFILKNIIQIKSLDKIKFQLLLTDFLKKVLHQFEQIFNLNKKQLKIYNDKFKKIYLNFHESITLSTADYSRSLPTLIQRITRQNPNINSFGIELLTRNNHQGGPITRARALRAQLIFSD